jgi:hypothetical protein
MRTAFIIDTHKNSGLLRFTETKLWFDAKNQTTDWIQDITVVDNEDDIQSDNCVIIESGDFCTTSLREYIKQQPLGRYDLRNNEYLIKFTSDYSYSMRDIPPYEQQSKQRYIIENLYKTVLKSKKLIYLEQTEELGEIPGGYDHLYGLASAWKTPLMAKHIGLENLKSVTVYDSCSRQLELAKKLHSNSQLPDILEIEQPYYGEYSPNKEIKEFWQEWSNYPVKFAWIDLFSTPKFKSNSYVWVSNAFLYEPTLFEFGYRYCQNKFKDLLLANKDCKINSN